VLVATKWTDDLAWAARRASARSEEEVVLADRRLVSLFFLALLWTL
jgi:hypothetical protein